MVNKTKTVGALVIAMVAILSLAVLPAMADDNETTLLTAEDDGNKTNMSAMAEIVMSQVTEEIEESENGFTGFPYSVLFLGTRYEVWRSYDSNVLSTEGTTITSGLMPVGENSTNWGITEEVTASMYSGEYYYAYSPPPEALGREYTIKFVAEYRNADGIVYRQDNSPVSGIFEVATFSMPTPP